MFYFLFSVGTLFIIIGLVSLIKSGFSGKFPYSKGMIFLIGGSLWIGFSTLQFNGNFLLTLPGNGFFSLFLAALGSAFLVWRSKIAEVLYKLYLPVLKFMFGDSIDWDNPDVISPNKWVLIFAGILCLLGAYANYFGQIAL